MPIDPLIPDDVRSWFADPFSYTLSPQHSPIADQQRSHVPITLPPQPFSTVLYAEPEAAQVALIEPETEEPIAVVNSSGTTSVLATPAARVPRGPDVPKPLPAPAFRSTFFYAYGEAARRDFDRTGAGMARYDAAARAGLSIFGRPIDGDRPGRGHRCTAGEDEQRYSPSFITVLVLLAGITTGLILRYAAW